MGNLIYEKDNVNSQKTYYHYDEKGRFYGEKVNSTVNSNAYANELYSNMNTFDDEGNVTKNSLSAGGDSYSTSYSYDENGNAVSTTISSSRKINYTFDDNKLIVRTTTTTTPINETFTYGDNGNVTQHVIGSDTYGYAYDDNGNITQITKNGSVRQSYVYDANSQLTRENNLDTNKTIIYTYDNGGNITNRKEYAYTTGTVGTATDTISYAYDSTWKDKLTSYDGQSITYDVIGNPVNYMGATIDWFGRQMQSYSKGNTSITYKYDSDGLRTQKVVNGIQYDYYYVDGQLRYEKKGDEYEIIYRYNNDGTLASVTRNRFSDGQTDILYAVTNTRGDVIELRSGSGAVNTVYTYDSWGKLVSVTNASGTALASTNLGVQNSIRYRGYVYDTETGLYYLQSRYYDPETGRFLNADDVDLIGFNESILSYNAYSYCENDPINENDTMGYSIETVLDVASIGWSVYELFKAPTWVNFGNLVWDIAATFIPFAPGSYVKKAGKVYLKIADKADDFKDIKSLTLGTYKGLKKLFKKIDGIEVHHIIEKRFSKLFDVGGNYFLSVPIHKGLHKTITKRWRNVCKYGTNYNNITMKQMKSYIRAVYYDMPKLRDQALKWLDQHWEGKL